MKPWLRATLIAALWVALNITLNLVNKHLFDVRHFKFPVFIIIFGTCCSFLGTLVLYLLHGGVRASISWHQIKSHWKLLLFVSIVHGLVSAFGNMSIVYISISLNQVLHTTMPALTIVLSFLIDNKRSSMPIIYATGLIVIGAGITVFKSPELEGPSFNEHFVGFIFVIIAITAGSIQAVVSAMLLQRLNINSWALILSTSLPMAISMLPEFLFLEVSDFAAHKDFSATALFLVLCTGIIAFIYTAVTYLLLQSTSALYVAVVSNLKVVMLVFLSILIFNTPYNTMNLMGIVVSLGGFMLYNYFMYQEKQQQQHEAATNNNSALMDEEEEEVEMVEVDHLHHLHHHSEQKSQQEMKLSITTTTTTTSIGSAINQATVAKSADGIITVREKELNIQEFLDSELGGLLLDDDDGALDVGTTTTNNTRHTMHNVHNINNVNINGSHHHHQHHPAAAATIKTKIPFLRSITSSIDHHGHHDDDDDINKES